MTDIQKIIWGKALLFLKGRPHSKKELRQKLEKAFPHAREDIERTLAEMERVELLNDFRFTEQFIRSLAEKPVGRVKLMAEAHRRGLREEIINNLLLEMEWNEEAQAKKALALKSFKKSDDPRKQKMQLVRFLQSRGFRDETIYRVVRDW